MNTSSYERMPGHWVLASMGKRVLRPGGLELSRWMIGELGIGERDEVVELAPGLGRTAELILEYGPYSYTGIEKSEGAAFEAQKKISGPNRSIRVGDAQATGLADEYATIACGEAFLTMQNPQVKEKIVKEVLRILKPHGLYGLHELSLSTDSAAVTAHVHRELSENIHVNARPLSVEGWKNLLEDAGFEILKLKLLPMALLEPGRLVKDEGVGGVAKLAMNLMLHPSAMSRVRRMRANFKKHSDVLRAVGIIAKKR